MFNKSNKTMLEYIISFKPIFIATISGVGTGYLLSCWLNYILFKQEAENRDSIYKTTISMLLWCIATMLAVSIIFIGFAALDYLLSFVPNDSLFYYARTMEYETIPRSFIISFFCGMSNTIIRICESAFAADKRNKT